MLFKECLNNVNAFILDTIESLGAIYETGSTVSAFDLMAETPLAGLAVRTRHFGAT